MTRLGPDVRLEKRPDSPVPYLRYLPQPGVADVPPLELHPLVGLILAYFDAGWRTADLEEHLLGRLGGDPEAMREIVGDVGVVFKGHFCHEGEASFVDVGDPEDLLAGLANGNGRGRFRSREVLFPNDRALFPMGVEWVVTRYCNRACIYCYQGAILNGKPKDSLLSTEKICEILSEARRLGAYNYFITGGEPLLRRDSYDILVHALELGMVPDIISKQFVKEEDVERLVAAGLETISFSIDSLDPAVAYRLTGIKPYAERMAQTVERFTSRGVAVTAKMVLTPLNLESLPATLEGLERLRVRKLAIEPYSENLQRHSDALIPSLEQLRTARAIVERFNERTDRELQAHLAFSEQEPAHEHDHGQDCFVCHVGTKSLLVLPDGKVGKCDKQLPGEDFVLGDLQRQSVHEVWNSQRMIAAMKPGRELYQGSLCYACDDFDICHERARCHYDAYLTSGTLYGPGSDCPYLETGAAARAVC